MGTRHCYAHVRKPATVQGVRPLIMGDKGDALKEPWGLPAASSQFSGLSYELMGEASSPSLVQTKLMVGPQGDQYEQEADRLAAAVVENMYSPVDTGAGQTAPLPQVSVVQRNSVAQQPTGAGGMAAPPELEASIQRARGGGHPLASTVRSPMEQSLGADLRGMRIHTDVQADRLNRSLQSRAFTTGRDIFFRQGEYQPQSRSGQALLAHELVHGVQQGAVGERIQCVMGGKNADLSPSGLIRSGRKHIAKGKREAQEKRAPIAPTMRELKALESRINGLKTIPLEQQTKPTTKDKVGKYASAATGGVAGIAGEFVSQKVQPSHKLIKSLVPKGTKREVVEIISQMMEAAAISSNALSVPYVGTALGAGAAGLENFSEDANAKKAAGVFGASAAVGFAEDSITPPGYQTAVAVASAIELNRKAIKTLRSKFQAPDWDQVGQSIAVIEKRQREVEEIYGEMLVLPIQLREAIRLAKQSGVEVPHTAVHDFNLVFGKSMRKLKEIESWLPRQIEKIEKRSIRKDNEVKKLKSKK